MMILPPAPRRRRPWRMALPLLTVLFLGVAWTGFWFYASAKAQDIFAAWRERGAQAGRHYSCGEPAFGGYPFRFELLCEGPALTVAGRAPPISLKAANLHLAAQVYDPTLLIAEIGAPMMLTQSGKPAVEADWKLAQLSLRGTPSSPHRLSIVVDDADIKRQAGAGNLQVLRAKRIEAHARARTEPSEHGPLLDLAFELSEASAPALHPIAVHPFDLTVIAVLHGLDSLRPLPFRARLRQLQAAGGRLEITRVRLQQGDVTAVGAGNLSLDPQGRLNGELTMTVAGLDRVLPMLGLDQIAPPGDHPGRLETALDKLDRVVPGLGRLARDHAGLGLAAGLALIGRPAELEGHKAVTLPLRFVDGAIKLGPFHVGNVPPLM